MRQKNASKRVGCGGWETSGLKEHRCDIQASASVALIYTESTLRRRCAGRYRIQKRSLKKSTIWQQIKLSKKGGGQWSSPATELGMTGETVIVVSIASMIHGGRNVVTWEGAHPQVGALLLEAARALSAPRRERVVAAATTCWRTCRSSRGGRALLLLSGAAGRGRGCDAAAHHGERHDADVCVCGCGGERVLSRVRLCSR